MRQKYIFAASAIVMASACTAPYYAAAAGSDAELITYDGMKFRYTDDSRTELCLAECEVAPPMAGAVYDNIICLPGVIGGAKVTSIDPDAFHLSGGAHANVWVPRSSGLDMDALKKLSERTGYCVDFDLCTAAVDGLIFEESTEVPGELLLMYCYAAGDIVVPEIVDGMPVTGILASAFSNNMSIRDVTLPDTVCYLDRDVFAYSSLRSVNIPKGVHVIPYKAFANCEQLENIELHDNIVRIYDGAFIECPYKLPEEYEKLYYGYGYSGSDVSYTGSVDDWRYRIDGRQGSSFITLTQYVGKETDLIIPAEILGESVGNCVLDLPDCVESVAVPGEIKLVDVSKAAGTQLKKLVFENPETCISGSFAGSSVEEAVISLNTQNSKLFEVPARMFDSCKELKKVKLLYSPDKDGSDSEDAGRLKINSNAFLDCKELTSVDLPDNAVSAYVMQNAFSGCSSLTDLGFLTKLSSVHTESRAFSACGIETADIKNWAIGSYAFGDCKALTELSLEDTSVADSAFHNCVNLENVKLSGSVKLADKSFDNCPSLKNVDIGEDVTSVHSFRDCPNLYTINGITAYDTVKKEFAPECSELVYKHFSGADDVGFINQFVQDKVRAAVAEAVTEDMTDIEKITALHDWLCRNAEYNRTDTNNRANHTDASIFFSGTTVCEGYARAYDLLLQEAGIESCCVGNADHEWNIVKVGGQCFHIDTTWDDGDVIKYSWFMKSDSELKNAGGYHAKWSMVDASSIHKKCFAALPECGYSVGDVNMDGEKNVADLVRLSGQLLGKELSGEGSGALSDLNFDGAVDTFDLVFMRRSLTSGG